MSEQFPKLNKPVDKVKEGDVSSWRKKDGSEGSKKVLYGAAREAALKAQDKAFQENKQDVSNIEGQKPDALVLTDEMRISSKKGETYEERAARFRKSIGRENPNEAEGILSIDGQPTDLAGNILPKQVAADLPSASGVEATFTQKGQASDFDHAYSTDSLDAFLKNQQSGYQGVDSMKQNITASYGEQPAASSKTEQGIENTDSQEQARAARIEAANEKAPEKQKGLLRGFAGAFAGFGKEMWKRFSGRNIREARQERQDLNEQIKDDIQATDQTIRLRKELLRNGVGEDGKMTVESVKKYREHLRGIQEMKRNGEISQDQFDRISKSLRENRHKKMMLRNGIKKSMEPWQYEANVKVRKSYWDSGVLWVSAASLGLGTPGIISGGALAGKALADMGMRQAALQKKGESSHLLKDVVAGGALKTLGLAAGFGEGNRAKARADVISYLIGGTMAYAPDEAREAVSKGIGWLGNQAEGISQVSLLGGLTDWVSNLSLSWPGNIDTTTLAEPLSSEWIDAVRENPVTITEGPAIGEVIGNYDLAQTADVQFDEYVVPRGGSTYKMIEEGILGNPAYSAMDASERANFIMNALEELRKPEHASMLREMGIDRCLDLNSGEVFTSQELGRLNTVISGFTIDVVTTDGTVETMTLAERADILTQLQRENILTYDGPLKQYCFTCPPEPVVQQATFVRPVVTEPVMTGGQEAPELVQQPEEVVVEDDWPEDDWEPDPQPDPVIPPQPDPVPEPVGPNLGGPDGRFANDTTVEQPVPNLGGPDGRFANDAGTAVAQPQPQSAPGSPSMGGADGK